ncbi:chromosome partitioning protein ParA [Pseudomonadota bacterium]
MEYIGCLLSKVPDVLWAAIIASCLTFIGVLLTNRGNQQSLAMQLSHNREMFVYEQEVSLKKEVYLDAAATFSRSLACIPKMANLDISMELISNDMEAHGPSAAKLYITAKEDTVAEVIGFSNELGESFLKLIKTRAELIDTTEAISIYQEMIKSSKTEQERILSIMKELNLNGQSDPEKWKYLNNCYDAENERIEETQKTIDDIVKENIPKHLQFSKLCMSEYARLSILISPMIMAVRSELHTSEDGDEFATIIRESMSRMQKSYDNYIKDITKA